MKALKKSMKKNPHSAPTCAEVHVGSMQDVKSSILHTNFWPVCKPPQVLGVLHLLSDETKESLSRILILCDISVHRSIIVHLAGPLLFLPKRSGQSSTRGSGKQSGFVML